MQGNNRQDGAGEGTSDEQELEQAESVPAERVT